MVGLLKIKPGAHKKFNTLKRHVCNCKPHSVYDVESFTIC